MNFSPFATQFAGIPENAVNQFATAKFAQNLTTANGQVIGVVSGGEGGVHYLRPFEGSTAFTTGQVQTNNNTNMTEQHQAVITVPITVPGTKPGEAQQTVHIQVINPNPVQQQTPKFQMGQMQIPIQSFQPGGTTVLTVAYSPQDGKFIPNHGFPEGMTVVAALQPQDLQLFAQTQATNAVQQQQSTEQNGEEDKTQTNSETVTIKQEPEWDNTNSGNANSQTDINDYMTQTQAIPINLQPFLKFNPTAIKYEHGINITTMPSAQEEPEVETDDGSKPKRKRKAKKKPPKPKLPKPGQVLIATAIDGTTLFCCPECEMVYPEKENLEQHLTVHKIERRYICDICGAGLKRKEHLERHKSGHNPDRPYICSVCMKGFKRKEHLNLHFVIHSGEKNEICGECGKGFYRKDHLRKHANSHVAKRIREEMNARANLASSSAKNNDSESHDNKMFLEPVISISTSTQMSDGQSQDQTNSSSDNLMNTSDQQNLGTQTQAAISLSTVYVPTSDNTTLPVQIQIPQIVTTSGTDGTTTNALVIPQTSSAPTESQPNTLMTTTQ